MIFEYNIYIYACILKLSQTSQCSGNISKFCATLRSMTSIQCRILSSILLSWSVLGTIDQDAKNYFDLYIYIINIDHTNPISGVRFPRGGLCQALQYILRARPAALVVGGPPCGSFVWINSATSRRSASQPFGDTTRQYVTAANKLLGHRSPAERWL